MIRLALLGAVLALGPAARYHSHTACPLQVRRVYLHGKAPQVVVRNKATYPVGHIVIHVAYQDLFTKYQEPTQAFDTVIAPDQRVTLSFPSLQGSVEWETMEVFATCEAADSVPGDSARAS